MANLIYSNSRKAKNQEITKGLPEEVFGQLNYLNLNTMKSKFYSKHAASIFMRMFAMICFVVAGMWTTNVNAQYCTPAASSNACVYMWITNVATSGGITNFSNASGCASSSYTDYHTTQSASQAPGSSITLTATSSGYGLAYNIYVDWNNNGSFTDAGELVAQMTSTSAGAISTSFTVPGGQGSGTYRMRVRGEYYGSGYPGGPCTTLTYGETEDYGFVVPSSCSGQPTGGTTVSTANPVCSGVAFTLSLSGATVGSGLTYQWQSSPTNSGFTNISGATGITYTTTQTTTTYYRCVITCTASALSAGSASLQVVQNPPSQCYCTPGTDIYSTCLMYMTNVTTTGGITNFNNTTGCNSPYINYSATISASQYQNTPITMSFSEGGGYGLGYAVWVDFNDDGVFSASEQVYININSASNTGVITGTWTVPMSAPVGTHRMRVRSDYYYYATYYSSLSDPCNAVYYGETEDYAFTVVQLPPCSGTPAPGNTISSGANPTCSSASFTLSLQNSTVGTGVTYQWYSSPNNTTYTAISGATNATYTTSQSSETWYECTVTCTNSSSSTTSTPLDVTQNPLYNCYCVPPQSSNYLCCGMSISNVTTTNGITNFNNTSGVASASYANYMPSIVASQYQGQTLTISATSTNYGFDFNVYIDYNDNGVFDASELVLQMTNGTSPGTATGNIAIPANANPGTHQMRIRGEYYGSGYPTGPCTQLQYGETEDYGITIVIPPPCSGTPTPGNTVISTPCPSVCSGVNFTLSLQNVPSTTGNTYQWFSSPNNTTYTAISGATALTYTTSQTTETWYECVVTCTNSSQSATSTPLDVAMGSSGQCNSYCLPTFYTGGPSVCTYIDNVTTSGGVSNMTTNQSTGFTGNVAYGMNMFACPVVSQYPSSSFTLNVQCAGTCNIAYLNVWVDWNQNGVFEASELMVANQAIANNATSFTINVPCNAVPGTTRMRIIDFGGGYAIGPCDNLSSYYSEGEDHLVTVLTPPACTGTPAPGNTLTSNASPCPGTAFNLSLQNCVSGSGVTYQWQYSYNNSTWFNVSGATASTYTATENQSTYWYCVVTCTNSGLSALSSSLYVPVSSIYNCYCVPPQSVNYNCCSMYISNVATSGGVTNFSNASSFATASYANYSPGISASQAPNSTITISATSNGYGLDYNVYIDFNDNGVFDASELVLQMGGTVAGTVSGTFTVPASAPTGTHQMRIRGEYYGSGYPTGPCTQLQYGETEDYGFTVPAPCSGSPAPGNTIAGTGCSGVCSGVNFTLSLQNASGLGATYQWYSSPNNTTYTAISGATAVTYTTSQTTATYYECLVTCTNSSLSTYSNPLLVTMGSNAQCGSYCYPTLYSGTNGCTYFNTITTSGAATNITTALDAGFNSNIATGVSFFPCPIIAQTAGQSFTLTEQCQGYCSIAYVNIWADWNQNGIFDASELLYGNVSVANNVTNFTINIPLSATIGTTRLRIIDFGGGYSIGACDNLTAYYSESEDYLLNVLPPPPLINYTALLNTCSTGDRQLNVNIQSYFGVDTATSNSFRPRVYYNKNHGTWFSQQGFIITGGPNNGTWGFPIVASDMGGLSVTDSVFYYVIAQDVNGGITSNPAGATATNVNTVSSPPSTVRSYAIVSGTPTLSLNVGSAICISGNTSLIAIAGNSSGNTGPFTYLWSTGDNFSAISILPPATPTVFSVTITDVCGTTLTASTTVTPAPVIAATANPSPVCPNGAGTTLFATSSDDPNYTYVWMPGNLTGSAVSVTLSSATTYTVTGTDYTSGSNGGCSNTSSTTVLVAPTPAVNVLPTSATVCAGSSISLTASSPSGAAVANYNFAQSTSTYTAISGGTVITGNTTYDDDANYSPVNLGFTFTYHGTTFTSIGVSDNGDAVLGGTPSGSYPTNVLTTETNMMTPFRNDLYATGSGSNPNHQLRYQTTGSTGNHVFTLEWFNWGFYSSGLAELNFQIKLYEASSAVQFVYQPVNPANSPGYFGGVLVGLTGASVSDFQDRNGSNWTTTTAGSSPSSPDHVVFNSSTYPPNGLTFTWTPPSANVSYTWSPASSLSSSTGSVVTATPPATQTYTVMVTDNNGCTNTATASLSVNLGPTAALTSTSNVSCNGGSNGSATVSVTGGVSGPYTFTWSGGVTGTTGSTFSTQNGLSAGTYSCIVSAGNGCSTTVSGIQITQPNVLLANPSVTNISCNGGSNGAISVSPSGGTAGYGYRWSNGNTTSSISGLNANLYSVTVTDAHVCTIVSQTTLTQPTVLSTSGSSASSVSCNGGSNGTATVSASGGTPPYNCTGTRTGLTAGTYNFIVTDSHGCTATTSAVTITQPSAVAASSSVVSNVSCPGGSNGSASVSASGGTAPYSGTGTFSGLTAGSYTYIVTDNNGCTGSTTVVISQPAAINISLGSNTPVCVGSPINLTSSATGGTGAFGYAWTGPNSYSATGANNSIASATTLNTGSYLLTVTDANGCSATATTTVSVYNCQTLITLKLYSQGYYLGGGQMQPVLYNEGVCGTCFSQTDTITVDLRNAAFPYGIVESEQAMLMVDGTALATFGPAIAGHSYYIAIRHRNMIQTSSAAPYAFAATGNSYDFSTAATQAYGNNMILVDVSPDIWAFYSGDINNGPQDQNIDLIDFPNLDFGINHGLFGYYASDLNGDGNVDLLDFPILDANINAGIFSQHIW